MKSVTIRGVEEAVSEKLKTVAAEQGKSVNQFTIEIIKKSLGFDKEKNLPENIRIWMTCLAGGAKRSSKR